MAPRVGALVHPVPVDDTGVTGPTRGQAAGRAWRRTSRGHYVPAHVVDDLVEQRIVEAAARAGRRGVVTAWAALRLHGGGFFDGLADDGRTRLPVPLAANGERMRSDAQVAVVRLAVPPDETLLVHGIRVASVERALYDEMRRRRTIRAMVGCADMAFAAELTSAEVMARYRATRRWYRDVRTIAIALDLTDGRSRSPQETAFRLIWQLDGGWGRPRVNWPVLDLDGRFVAVPDLVDPARGVVGEFAGAHHRDLDRHRADVAREADLRALGLEYVETVGRDLRDPRLVVRRMLEAEERAAASGLPRRWQLASPEVAARFAVE